MGLDEERSMSLFDLLAVCDVRTEKLRLGAATPDEASLFLHQILIHTLWWGRWKSCKIMVCSSSDPRIASHEDITDACILDYRRCHPAARAPDTRVKSSQEHVIEAEFVVVKP